MKPGGYSSGAPFRPTQFCKSEDQPERMALLGEKFEIEQFTYRFVKVHTLCIGGVIPSNAVLYYTAPNVVTNDSSESLTALPSSFAGIAWTLDVPVPQSLAGSTYYMLMQEPIRGDMTLINTNGDDDIVVGDLVIADADGVCDSYLVDPAAAGAPTDGELQTMQLNCTLDAIGVAIVDDDNTADTVMVKFL